MEQETQELRKDGDGLGSHRPERLDIPTHEASGKASEGYYAIVVKSN